MTIHSRLHRVQKSLKGREVVLLWLKTAQASCGYLEYWERGEFHYWASENDETALPTAFDDSLGVPSSVPKLTNEVT